MKDKNFNTNNGKNDYTNADPLSRPEIHTPDIPEVIPPTFNPPVPNRAWTAMKAGKDIDDLTDEERNMLYYGKDQFF